MNATTEFPRAGVLARRWRRFEEELHEWLASPQGRFLVYCAERDRGASLAVRPLGAHGRR